MTELSIIIVNWNGKALLRDCLASIPSAGLVGHRIQTIVVDNASSDGSVDMVRSEFPWVEVIPSAENLGFSAGNNLGLPLARGRWVMLLNNDTLLPARFLPSLLDYLQQQSAPMVLGPKLLNPDGSLQPSVGCFPSLRRLFLSISMIDRVVSKSKADAYIVLAPEFYHHERRVDWISGACLVAHRSVFDTVGGLDPGYFMYVEEVDWCRRASLAGFPIRFWPGAELVHINSGSAKSRKGKVENTYRSLLRYFEKFGSPANQRALPPVLALATLIKLAASAAALLAGRRPEDARDCLRAYSAGLKIILERKSPCAS